MASLDWIFWYHWCNWRVKLNKNTIWGVRWCLSLSSSIIFSFLTLKNDMFPALLPRIIWHYASETEEDCCFNGFFYVECIRATFDFYRYFRFVINCNFAGNSYKAKEQTVFLRHFWYTYRYPNCPSQNYFKQNSSTKRDQWYDSVCGAKLLGYSNRIIYFVMTNYTRKIRVLQWVPNFPSCSQKSSCGLLNQDIQIISPV